MSITRCCQILFILSWPISTYCVAQSLPTVGSELEFAGISVELTAPGQQRLQQEVARLYADRTALRNALEQMRYIQSILEPLLDEHSIPADFRYLCLPLNQSGGPYWSLDNPAKARSLGLRIDDQIDERLNIASASNAVLSELALLHVTQPNWIMVLLQYTGYRTGQPPTSPLPTRFTLLPDSPLAVWTTLARKIVFEQEAPLMRSTEPYLLYDYRPSRGKSLATIARELGIDQSRFVPFNEWLRGRVIPLDKAYPVLIRLTPSEFLGVKSQLNASVQGTQLTQPDQVTQRTDMGFPMLKKWAAATSNDPLTRLSAQFYTINELRGILAQPCDNAVTLSYYGAIPVRSFLEYNDLTERDPIRAGEIYYLERKAKEAKIPFHVVQYGQSMRDISSIYGVRLANLLRYNRMEPTQRVQSGRIVWMQTKRPANQPIEYRKLPDVLPEPEPTVAQRKLTREDDETQIDMPSASTVVAPASLDSVRAALPRPTAPIPIPAPDDTEPAKDAFLHEVRPGDTFTIIAQRYRLTVPELLRLNNWQLSKPLVVGQQLVISAEPAAAAVPPTTTAVKPVTITRAPTAGTSAATPANDTRPSVVASQKTRENAESTVDTERPDNPTAVKPTSATAAVASKPVNVVPPAVPLAKPVTTVIKQRLLNQARVETPKVNGTSYYHIVQPGQTVYRVALINRVSVPNVMRWNNLSSYTIEIGQRILIRK